MADLVPADEADLRDAVATALASQTPLEICGAGSRRGLGRPVDDGAVALSMRRFSKVIFYEPSELVLRAQAGVSLSELEALLASEGQEFAFEPIDHGALYGETGGAMGGTVGGLIAVDASGPRRFKAGAARDHLLGFRGVTGRGDLIKSGGRVMKNVTGFDLSKLICGAHGTLAAVTEATFKVLPKAERQLTLSVAAPDEDSGLALLREASGLPLDLSGLALEPKADNGALRAHFRLEGSARSVAARREALCVHLGGRRGSASMDERMAEESASLWRRLRDAHPVCGGAGAVWRLSVAPSEAHGVMRAIESARVALSAYFYDWVGGLIWLRVESDCEAGDAGAAAVRGAVDCVGGHATLMRAPLGLRRRIDVFHPQPPALAALTRRVKDSFDPLRVLNRGRMRAEASGDHAN